MNDGPHAGGREEQLGFFHRDGRPAIPPPAGNPTARDLYRFKHLWQAYRECRRTKRGTLNALAFEWDAEAGLFELQQDLLSHRYKPGTSICFVTDGPKPREVFAADFRDRIVHHLLLGRVEPVFEKRFIHDSFACRKGKGVLAASDRLTQFLREATAGGRRPAWALKLDVASFFPSIRKSTLYDIACAAIRDPELRWLTATILFHDSTGDFVFHKGPRFVPHPVHAGYPVEARKSLFGRGGETGLPIGNLTSQFWANCYLNELDHFVKRRLGCRHYLRYVDDLVLLAPSPDILRGWHSEVAAFLSERLGLRLRTDGDEPFLVSRGIDFAGWKTWASYRVPRRRTLAMLDRRLGEAGRTLVRRDEKRGFDTIDLTVRVVREPGAARREVVAAASLLSMLTSYSGHLRWGASWNEWHAILSRHPWLTAIYAREGWQVALRWPPRVSRQTKLWQQYWGLAGAAAPGTMVFSPVGAFVEFRGPFVADAVRVLGLRHVRLARGQWAFGAGFPVRASRRYETRAVEAGWSVAVAGEGEWRGRRACRSREVVRVLSAIPPTVGRWSPRNRGEVAGSPSPSAS